MEKDWIGTPISPLKTIGSTRHSVMDRVEFDYYATEPVAVKMLLELENFDGDIWECACGEGHLSKEIESCGYKVYSSDLIDREYGEVLNFLSVHNKHTNMNIITNPPYKYANEFIIKAMEIMEEGKKLALFLPIRYLEGKARKKIFEKYPLKTLYVSASRLQCARNGNFIKRSGGAVAFGWFIWIKGFNGVSELKWFN
jgi:hypothetical protein